MPASSAIPVSVSPGSPLRARGPVSEALGLTRGSDDAGGGENAPPRNSTRGMIDARSKEGDPWSAPAWFTGSTAGTTPRVSAKNSPAAASRVRSAIAPPGNRYWGGVVCCLAERDLGLRPLVRTGYRAYIPKLTRFQ